MNTRLMLIIALGALGCEKPETSAPAQATHEPEKPAVAAQLSGFGDCRLNRCTVHFAVDASGDAQTMTGTRCATQGTDCGVRKGMLTDAGREEVKALTRRLLNEKLEATYGCPGCADGPITELVLHHPDGTETRHKLDPMRTSELPQALRDASSFVDSVQGALERCEGSARFTPDATCSAELAKDERHEVGVP